MEFKVMAAKFHQNPSSGWNRQDNWTSQEHLAFDIQYNNQYN